MNIDLKSRSVPDEAWQILEALPLLVQAEESQQHVSVAWSMLEVLLPPFRKHGLNASAHTDRRRFSLFSHPAEQVYQHAGHQCYDKPFEEKRKKEAIQVLHGGSQRSLGSC